MYTMACVINVANSAWQDRIKRTKLCWPWPWECCEQRNASLALQRPRVLLWRSGAARRQRRSTRRALGHEFLRIMRTSAALLPGSPVRTHLTIAFDLERLAEQ